MTTVHYARCRTNCEHAAAANAIAIVPTAGGYTVDDGDSVYTWHREDNAEYHAEMLRQRICHLHHTHICDCTDVIARGSLTPDEAIGRVELDRMKAEAGITVDVYETVYYGKPKWNETVCFVWQDRKLMEGFKSEANANTYADELAMEMAAAGAIGAGANVEVA